MYEIKKKLTVSVSVAIIGSGRLKDFGVNERNFFCIGYIKYIACH